MRDLILVIDEGTTSTRAMLFAPDGQCRGSASGRADPTLSRRRAASSMTPPKSGTQTLAMRARDGREGGRGRSGSPRSASPTSARPWCSGTGTPASRSRPRSSGRTGAPPIAARELQASAGTSRRCRRKTGLLLDPYFSATKIGWALENWPQLREAGDRLAVGTVESWLVCKLTGGLHVTDATNASRTALMAIGSGGWDDGLIDLFGVPRAMRCPRSSTAPGSFGETTLFGARHPDLRHGRRPAGGDDRPGLPRNRARPRRPSAPARSC